MRILILTISYAPNVGGVETHLLDWTRWLNGRNDLEVDVLTYQPITTRAKGPSVEQEDRVRIFRIPWFGRQLFHKFESKPILQFLYLAPRLLFSTFFHILRHKKYDVIHAQGLIAIWVAGQLKRFWKIPVLGSLHTVYVFKPDSSTGRRIRRVLGYTDHLLSCACSGTDQLRAYGLSENRIGTFTYWVDQDVFAPLPSEQARQALNLAPNATVVLFVGRLIEVKGVRIFLELAQKHPEFFFMIAGDGPLETDCAAAFKHLPNFRYLGCMSNHSLTTLYNAGDLLLVPSLFTEGIPRVICEALSCGLPVIASDRGGSKEALTAGIGLLTEPTTDSFSKALKQWIQQGGTSPLIRHHCRAFAEEHFSSRNAETIETCLLSLITKPH